MNPEQAEPLEDTLMSLAASCDEALADGRAPDPQQTALVPEEHRSDLQGRIDCMRLLRQAWAGDSGTTSGRARPSNAPTAIGTDPILYSSVTAPSHIGRFEVRRELGRGGFGVVFLAHDPLLHRDVALKVPRTEAFLDPQLRVRLHREATIAAGLDHPNIVPIYEAGEAGPVWYIASAYCPGVTLAAWLNEQTVLAPFRDAATLTATLAEAVHYAHGRGVVHRDLKPANILLVSGGVVSGEWSADSAIATHHSPLTAQQPKITDFGLAKLLDDKNGAAQPLTLAGTFLGTPEYMAPEQAGTAAGPVGPATDVYALGVILYEMLAGRPPFQGDSTLDILRQVETAEPVPPGRLRPRLPRDLETICLKCLDKESRRRYAGADALGADLRRFLAGEPVRARPVSQTEKLWRWCRRKPVLAGLLAALVLVFLAGSGGVLWQWQRATRERDTALREKARAERRLQMVGNRVDRLSELGSGLLRKPGMYRTGQEVLEEALAFYQQLLPEEGNDPSVRLQAAKLVHQVARIHFDLGHAAEAAEAFGHEARLLISFEEKPADKALRLQLADSHRWLGNALGRLGKTAEAQEAYQHAAQLHGELLDESPDDARYQVALANTLINTATLLSPRNQAEKLEALFRSAVTLNRAAVSAVPKEPKYRAELALGLADQGLFFLDMGRVSDAEDALREALDIHQGLVDGGHLKGYIESYLARNHVYLGRVQAAAGRASEAERSYQNALEMLNRLAEELPESGVRREELAQALAGLADLLKDAGRRPETEEFRRQVIDHYERLQADFPENLQYQRSLVLSYLELASLLSQLGQPNKATEPYRKALDLDTKDPGVNNIRALFLLTTPEPRLRDSSLALRLATNAVAAEPESADYSNTLGVAYFRNGDDKATITELERAMSLREGGNSFDWFFLAMAHSRQGDRDQAQTWFDRAVQWMDKHRPRDDDLRRFRAEAEAMLVEARQR
jgi:serine/threonine protein kinase/Tfp pilus assembly protein PilF